MIHHLLFDLCWLACLAWQPTHTLQYAVWHGDDQVGTMQVARFEQGERTTIRVRMQAEVELLFSLSIESTYETTFENGQMTAAQVRTYRNDELHSYTNCWLEEGQLHIDRDGKRSLMPLPVQYTIANSYFGPPTPQQEVFSERFGSFQSFEQLSDGCFRLELSDGSRSTYRYVDNTCQTVEVETWLTDLRMERQ